MKTLADERSGAGRPTRIRTGAGSGFELSWEEVEPVEGWLTRDQGRVLYEAATRARPGEWIVEIGSHHGKSTVLLARGAGAGVKVLAIDPFDDPRWGGGEASYQRFRDQLVGSGVELIVTHWRTRSDDAARAWPGDDVALLYVDGAHDRASVRSDLTRWEAFLRPRGLVLVHDAYSSPGVTAALLGRHFANRDFAYRGATRSLVCLERIDGGSLRQIVSGLRLVLRLPYLARNLGVKVALRRHVPALAVLLGHRGDEPPY